MSLIQICGKDAAASFLLSLSIGDVVRGTRSEITQGTSLGETGVGHSWYCGPYGDISAATRGYYQGYQEPALIEIIRPGVFRVSIGGELRFYPPGGPRGGFDADEAIEARYARLVDPDEEPYRALLDENGVD